MDPIVTHLYLVSIFTFYFAEIRFDKYPPSVYKVFFSLDIPQ